MTCLAIGRRALACFEGRLLPPPGLVLFAQDPPSAEKPMARMLA